MQVYELFVLVMYWKFVMSSHSAVLLALPRRSSWSSKSTTMHEMNDPKASQKLDEPHFCLCEKQRRRSLQIVQILLNPKFQASRLLL